MHTFYICTYPFVRAVCGDLVSFQSEQGAPLLWVKPGLKS